MKSEQPAIVTIPTLLDRAEGFFDMAALFGYGGIAWWAALRGVPLWYFIPGLIPLALWSLSGEPAGDIGLIGWFAAWLRSKLGLRRASTWALAWTHYFQAKVWPNFTRWLSVRLQRMHVALSRVRWIRRILDWSMSTVQRSHARMRLSLRLPRRLRSRAAEVSRV